MLFDVVRLVSEKRKGESLGWVLSVSQSSIRLYVGFYNWCFSSTLLKKIPDFSKTTIPDPNLLSISQKSVNISSKESILKQSIKIQDISRHRSQSCFMTISEFIASKLIRDCSEIQCSQNCRFLNRIQKIQDNPDLPRIEQYIRNCSEIHENTLENLDFEEKYIKSKIYRGMPFI